MKRKQDLQTWGYCYAQSVPGVGRDDVTSRGNVRVIQPVGCSIFSVTSATSSRSCSKHLATVSGGTSPARGWAARPCANSSWQRPMTDGHALTLTERLFDAMSRRDFKFHNRRFILRVDGDDDLSLLDARAFLCIDRRRYAERVYTMLPTTVEHFVCEHGHTLSYWALP